MVPVQSTQVVAAPTMPVNAPSRVETKQAFDEVSSALQTVSSKHEKVCADMQGLASGVEELWRARVGDVETTAQVQATLQRTLSTLSSLEMRLGHTEEQEVCARAAAEEAKRASEQALSQAAILRAEQEKSTRIRSTEELLELGPFFDISSPCASKLFNSAGQSLHICAYLLVF